MLPIFITLEQALQVHEKMIMLFGGTAEVRDMGLLQSALGMPAQSFAGQFLHEFPGEMAAAYLFHICKNHPFVDGNKRTAATVARVFLLINGCTFEPTEKAYGDLTLGVAAGELDKSAVAAFFKKHVKPA